MLLSGIFKGKSSIMKHAKLQYDFIETLMFSLREENLTKVAWYDFLWQQVTTN